MTSLPSTRGFTDAEAQGVPAPSLFRHTFCTAVPSPRGERFTRTVQFPFLVESPDEPLRAPRLLRPFERATWRGDSSGIERHATQRSR